MTTNLCEIPMNTSTRAQRAPSETTNPPTGPGPAEMAGSAPLRRVTASPDFRLLLGGTSTSLIGDQFALIATPWLVLHLTGDPLALGIVLALEGLPRAALMLLGGALTDRFSPRRMMLTADLVRCLLTSAMAAAVLSGTVQLWLVYCFAAVAGSIAGLTIPAENSIVPALVERDDLQAGNALIMGATQIAAFVGPTLAGATIAASATSVGGVGLAYAIDAVTFGVSTLAFLRIRSASARARSTARSSTPGAAGLRREIGDGFRHLWGDEALRFVFQVLAAVNLLVVGPLMVGIPLLAERRLSGAMAFGVLMGAFAAGNLVGIIVAGATRAPSGQLMGRVVLGVLTGYGAGLASLGVLSDLPAATTLLAVLLASLGAGNGYLAIGLFTWAQTRTPEHLLGRVMSLVTFSSLGLVSLSQAAVGALSRLNLDALFVLSGALVLAATAWAGTRPGLRALSTGLARSDPADQPVD